MDPAADPQTAGGVPQTAQRPKVIYVMGQGKSGSTILGVALGNCDDVFYAGELVTWLLASGRPVIGGAERVRFWRAVRERVDGAQEMFGSAAYAALERGASIVRIDKWPQRRAVRPRYRRVTESLYRTLAAESGATHVVDTSHLPLRARELQSMDGIELYLIFLVRDAEAVVASHASEIKRHEVTQRRMRVAATSARLWITYLLSIGVFLRQPPARRMLLRHEDFIADPEASLARILRMAGAPETIPDLAHLKTGIPLVANPFIREAEVALRPSAAPPHRASRTMRLLQRPWDRILSRLGRTGGNGVG